MTTSPGGTRRDVYKRQVLTGDAHGAGLVEMAGLLRAEGIGRFAVSEPADAAALRLSLIHIWPEV